MPRKRTNSTASFNLVAGEGSEAIVVEVTRKPVRNLNLRVRRDGSVAMSIPQRSSREQAQAFLNEREAWLRRALERRRTRIAEATGQAAVATTSYPLWGRMHNAPDDAPLLPAQIDEIYRAEVARALPEIILYMEAIIGAHATAWQLRAMKTRWGSCTPKTGRIRINLRLAAYPRECLEYVVAHELAHLLEPSHNERFHAIVARAIPNEREVRARLRKPPQG